MMLERDLVTTAMRPASEFAMWYAKNEPDVMTKRLYMWRMENQALCAQAESSEDKAAGRIAVEMPTAHRATEFSVDRERVFEYVKKGRRIVPHSFSDRFFSLPYLPTFFDRAYEHQRRHAVDYYGDVRELTQEPVFLGATVADGVADRNAAEEAFDAVRQGVVPRFAW